MLSHWSTEGAAAEKSAAQISHTHSLIFLRSCIVCECLYPRCSRITLPCAHIINTFMSHWMWEHGRVHFSTQATGTQDTAHRMEAVEGHLPSSGPPVLQLRTLQPSLRTQPQLSLREPPPLLLMAELLPLPPKTEDGQLIASKSPQTLPVLHHHHRLSLAILVTWHCFGCLS